MTKKQLHLVIVTGMSGAGKTVAIQSFEDLGYFTIDNMPPALLPKFLQLVETKDDDHKLALVVDMRSRSFFSDIQAVLDELENQDDLDFKILFLDAADKELVARYKETRRSHPLAADGRILDGIKLERELLAPLKNMSQNVVDTTELTPRELRKTIAVSKSCLLDSSMVSLLMQTWSLMSVSCQIHTTFRSSVIRQVRIEQFMTMS